MISARGLDMAAAFSRRSWEKKSPGLIMALLTIPALFLAGRYGNWQITVLWSGVFFLTGALIGFLFGVPSATPQPDSGAESRGLAENNLQQIADWLTKMLIGIALINLKDAPAHLGNLTRYVASALDAKDKAEPFVTALVFYFGATGFLAGLLACRVYFRLLSTESGAKTVARLADGFEATLTQQIERALRGPVMVNYKGYFCVALWESGSPLRAGDFPLRLARSAGELEIRAWLQRDPPSETNIASAPVSIRDGEDRDTAEFEIRLDADHFKVESGRRSVTVGTSGASERVAFRAAFHLEPEPASSSGIPGEDLSGPRLQHPLWLMLFQQNRLVQTITCDFQVERS